MKPVLVKVKNINIVDHTIGRLSAVGQRHDQKWINKLDIDSHEFHSTAQMKAAGKHQANMLIKGKLQHLALSTKFAWYVPQ